MTSVSRKGLVVGTVLAVALIAACSAEPMAPRVRPDLKALLPDNVPIPCDSTIITDGTCRGGYIIPY